MILRPTRIAINAFAAWVGLTSAPWPCAGQESPPAATARQREEWRSLIRSTLFIPDPLPALEPETHGRFRPEPGVVAERVTYGTQFGLRIPAILYLPEKRLGKIPAIIVVNGHGGDKFTWYSFYSGILYARAGAAVLTYDPIGEGERHSQRRSGTRVHDRHVEPSEIAQRLSGLMVTDVMQAVSYLAGRPEVDSGRIAAAGYSMGSFVLGIAGAVETRLNACVLVGGGNFDGPDGYWDQSSKTMCQGIPYRSLSALGDRPAVLYALHASRGSTLVYNGLADTVVSIPSHAESFFFDLRQRTGRLLESSGTLFEVAFVPGASHRPFFVTKPVALWLERQIDFPAWSEADIEGLPETHISAWARDHGVPLDRLYATEEREGGTRALGRDVPALGRADLFVLPAEEWEQRKGRMIYESWLSEAKLRLPR